MKKILDIAAFLFLLANIVFSCVFYFTTDEIAIPAHWSMTGRMDEYGQTWMILVLAAISAVIYVLMVFSERHHAINLPFKVKHLPQALPIVDMCLAWNNALVMLILLYVDLAVARYVPMSMALLWALILVIIVLDFYYTRKIYKCGREK